jgi:hypothetical protein
LCGAGFSSSPAPPPPPPPPRPQIFPDRPVAGNLPELVD